MSTPSIAANAYASLARLTDPAAGLAKATGGGEGAVDEGAALGAGALGAGAAGENIIG